MSLTKQDKKILYIKSGADMLTTKLSTADKELRTISYVLQEILQKNF